MATESFVPDQPTLAANQSIDAAFRHKLIVDQNRLLSSRLHIYLKLLMVAEPRIHNLDPIERNSFVPPSGANSPCPLSSTFRDVQVAPASQFCFSQLVSET